MRVGEKRMQYLEQNLGALELRLTSEELKAVDVISPKGAVVGTRYPESMRNTVGR
jgi:aryl-alcohol dehydrogenase-like predicted oxidoreductase